jgi:hypothetical protein
VCGLRGFPVGGLGSSNYERLGDLAEAAGNLAAAPYRLPGQPCPRPPGWQPPTPATAALSTSGNSWPTSSASSIEQLTLRSRRRGPQRSEDTRRQAGEAGP